MYYEIIIKWVIPFALTTAITLINKFFKELKVVKKQNAEDHCVMKKSMLSSLRVQLVTQAERYLELGYLSDYARFTLSDLLKSYKELGGNHGVEKLIDQCLELPRKKK